MDTLKCEKEPLDRKTNTATIKSGDNHAFRSKNPVSWGWHIWKRSAWEVEELGSQQEARGGLDTRVYVQNPAEREAPSVPPRPSTGKQLHH